MENNRTQLQETQQINLSGREELSRREACAKHFHLGGNRYQAVIYPQNVHFRNPETGAWQEIDNTLDQTLTAAGRRVFRNRAGRLKMEFPQEMDGGSAASLTDNGRTFAWSFEGELQPAAAMVRTGLKLKQQARVQALSQEAAQQDWMEIDTLNAEAAYEEVLPGVSLRYGLSGESLKEDIILASAEALNRVALRLPREYDYEVTHQAQLRVKDRASGEALFVMQPPFVYDSAGEETFAQVRLTNLRDYVRLEYEIDSEFMKNAVYPVTIDPVVKTATTQEAVCDSYIWKKNPNTNYGSVHLMRCGTGAGGESISLVKFNRLISLKASDTVLSAMLRLTARNYASNPEIMGCYPIKTPWTEDTVTWNSMTPDDDTHISRDLIAYIPATTPTNCDFDITAQYRDWYLKDASGNSRNFGVAIRRPPEVTSGGNYVEWGTTQYDSSKGPRMVVTYVSHAGRKGWWQYDSMSAGRAGSAYVDLFNGNLVYEHGDGATTGSRMPLAISHVYNSCLSESNAVSCGMGWRTSLHQGVSKRSLGGASYYVWTDGDATEHFFKISGSQPYADEEGMSLKLTTGSGELTITDKGDTKLIFPVPSDATEIGLLRMTDACGNTASLIYDASGRLAGATDGAGRTIVYSYNAEGLLSQIAVPGRPQVNFAYTGQQLTWVSYSDVFGGTSYGYEADSNLLTAAANFDGNRIDLTYEGRNAYDAAAIDNYAAQVRRVLSMEASNGTLRGAKRLYDYQHLTTRVTAVETAASDAGKTVTYQFNNAGNVTCAYDELGYARSTRYEDPATAANLLTGASRLKRAVVNQLINVDFSANWTAYLANGGDAAAQDANTRCLNMPSLKLTKAGVAESRHCQSVYVNAPGKYTFSAYVKNDGTGGQFLRLRTNVGAYESRFCDGQSWDRLFVTGEMTAAGNVTVELVSTAPGGSGWYACPQLEEGSVANHVNLLLNGDFTRTYAKDSQTFASDWSISEGISTNPLNGVVSHGEANLPEGLRGNASRIHSYCNTSASSHCQSISAKGEAGDVFVVGGWVNATSVASGSNHFRACLITRFLGTDGKWSDLQYNEFAPQRVGWKYDEWAIKAPKAYKEFRIGIQYARNTGTAMFTNLFIHREEFGESYAYDSNRNVVSVSTLSGQKSAMQYDSAHNLKSYRQPGAPDTAKYTLNYGSSPTEQERHLLQESTTPMGQRDAFTYDTYGNLLSSTRQKSGDGAFIKSESTYTADGNYKVTSKDARGNVVFQNVNATDGTLQSVTDPNGQTVYYAYDASKRVTGVQTDVNGKPYKNGYSYENDRIKTVAHNTTGDAEDVFYTFGYDALGRKTTVQVGNQVLSTNAYHDNRSGLLKEVQYGNGGKVQYDYDGYDRLTGVRYDGETTPRYAYEYGADGNASMVKDNHLGRVYHTQHDLADRLMDTQLRNADGSLIYRTGLEYDAQNRLTALKETLPIRPFSTGYTYDNDNRVTGMTFDGENALNYTYDNLGRIATRTMGPLSSTYGYVDGGYGAGSTTPLVSSIQQTGISFAYTYDNRGNIVSETRNGATTTYAYDALGQLVRVNDPHENATWVYNYDRGGNITSKVKYAFTTGDLGAAVETVPYAYGDANWKDKLTAYNGTAITYDAIGNPLNDGTWTYTWTAGRQLAQMSKDGMTVQYKYDHNGLRVAKIVNGVETRYILNAKRPTHLYRGNDWMHFFYDAQGRPAKVRYNGTIYSYIHNLRGDIVGIIDTDGNVVVEYKYDAWGKALSTTGTLAGTLGSLNPFRYRGYIYDEETGLYYLRMRYYGADACRFLSADRKGTEKSLYTYCSNSPINFGDWNGMDKSRSESSGDITNFMREGFWCNFEEGERHFNPLICADEKTDVLIMYIPYQDIQYYNNSLLYEEENPLDAVMEGLSDEAVSVASDGLETLAEHMLGAGKVLGFILSALDLSNKYSKAVQEKAKKANHRKAQQLATDRKTGIYIVVTKKTVWDKILDITNPRKFVFGFPKITVDIKYYEATEYLK